MQLLCNRNTLEQYAKFYSLIYHRHYSTQLCNLGTLNAKQETYPCQIQINYDKAKDHT